MSKAQFFFKILSLLTEEMMSTLRADHDNQVYDGGNANEDSKPFRRNPYKNVSTIATTFHHKLTGKWHLLSQVHTA